MNERFLKNCGKTWRRENSWKTKA